MTVSGTDDAAEGSGSGSSMPIAPITATRYLQKLGQMECDQAFTCRAQFPSDAGYTFEDVWSTSPQSCYDLIEVDWQPETVESEIAMQRILYDGTQAAQCLAQITFGDCQEYFYAGPQFAGPCYHVMKPLVPGGGACQVNESCTSGSCDAMTHVCA